MEGIKSKTLVEIGELIAGSSNTTGVISGLQEAALQLRTKAGEFYAEGRDLDAKAYRSCAEILQAMAQTKKVALGVPAHERYKAAFTELERRDEIEEAAELN